MAFFSLCGLLVLLCSMFVNVFGGVPRTSGRAFRSYSGTEAAAQTFTGVSASIPHPMVQPVAFFAGRFYAC